MSTWKSTGLRLAMSGLMLGIASLVLLSLDPKNDFSWPLTFCGLLLAGAAFFFREEGKIIIVFAAAGVVICVLPYVALILAIVSGAAFVSH